MTQVSVAQDGISKLLAAEQEAQQIVTKARKAKTDRLKQAKAEAERDIAAYRAERESLYQQKLSSHASGAGDTVKRLAQESDAQVLHIQQSVAANKNKVVEILSSYVTTASKGNDGEK